jgi:hypothetical protein
MPLTHFPNGLSVQTASADNSSAGAGALQAAAGSVFGQTTVVTFKFASTSTAETGYIPTPFDGNITAAYVITGATITVTTGFTVRVGSAGSVAVATVANTSGLLGRQSSLTTTTTAITTADSIGVTKAAAGTTGTMTIGVVVARA